MNQPTCPTIHLTDASDLRLLRPRGYCRAAAVPSASNPVPEVPRNQILLGDALTRLCELPTGSVDVAITSPPYHLLRRYEAGPEEIGTEPTVAEYVERIVGVCDELARVLKPTGSLLLNLGDSYSRHLRYGSPPKGLLLGPERILLALAERGWIVRNKIVWSKPNGLPTSVRDRFSSKWEPIYFLVRSQSYFFDLGAVRLPHRSTATRPKTTPSDQLRRARPRWAGPLAGSNNGLLKARAEGRAGHPDGRNPGDVLSFPTASFRGEHPATFPVALIEHLLVATCPERVCRTCGRPWVRRDGRLRADCLCRGGWLAGVVCDPFMGAGTTALAAERHGREWLGIELAERYRELALDRLATDRRRRAGS